MSTNLYSVITATGKYLPARVIPNEDFYNQIFYDSVGEKLTKTTSEIVEKFEQITDIKERRHVSDNQVTSDIAFLAAQDTLRSSTIDKEQLDYIIVAHNFGDVKANNKRSDFVPSIAARVKFKLGIKNPFTVAYDLPFGCAGWLQGLIQADYFLKSGDARKIMVIGAEVLSRISDPHDRDSMLFADGAGAVLVEAKESENSVGILAHNTRSDTLEFAHLLRMDKSNNPEYNGQELFLKMDGRKLYEYALKTVPQAIQQCLEKAKLPLQAVTKVLIHQANGKMDDAILKRLYGLYSIAEIPKNVMPMTISWLGNASVATIPTLLDLLLKGELKNQGVKSGDIIVLASVGAGMNINSVVYRMP
ncbi:3-oxoacyl-ACP synthase [Adhaeribacter arboris]|uniref:3-oxoacyl-ACP synthase n=1 Tax=Adhaeribacter arboris TaxID=2072846 RepID=A0A2T2YLA0_9BACT|nr:ketoacyl-ACP synthase III [Adhaeribacter arboris]PSR56292.1 3-oxoacyl-ACP synthase [Adhaeribacter arboris]